MSRLARAFFVALSLCACTKGTAAPGPRVVAPSSIAIAPSPTSSARGSTLEGVTLVREDLDEAARAVEARDSYTDRVARIRAVLGVEGDAIPGGFAFRAIGAKSATGPVDCVELAVLERAPGSPIVPVDRRLCGLPYRDDASRPYAGPGPRFTVARIRRVLEELTHLPAADADAVTRARLGPPDDTPASLTGAEAWFAVGPRSHDTPVTCHVLVVPSAAPARIEVRPLGDCDLPWPPSPSAFARDDSPSAPQATAPDDECKARCAANQVCIARRVVEPLATVARRGDEVFAFRYDGRPATVEVSTTCRASPPPEGCTAETEEVLASPLRRSSAGMAMLVCTTRRARK